jgi:hypothetical protein
MKAALSMEISTSSSSWSHVFRETKEGILNIGIWERRGPEYSSRLLQVSPRWSPEQEEYRDCQFA